MFLFYGNFRKSYFLIKLKPMNIIKNAFVDKTTPVMVIECFTRIENQRPKRNFSGMGFLYKKNDDGSYLFVTCGHFFWPELFHVPPGSDLFITKDFGTNNNPPESNFLPFQIVKGPIFSKNKRGDITMFKVRPVIQPPEEFKLFEASENLEDLSDAGAVSLTMVNEQSIIDLICNESSKKLPYDKYNFGPIQAGLMQRGTILKTELYEHEVPAYPCYQIFSDFGASGSPIWTKDGKLLGMNLGGEPGVWTAVVTTRQINNVIKELGL